MKGTQVIDDGLTLKRIRRIKGQIEAIERMMLGRKSCLSVVQQILAAKSALASLAVELLYRESCTTGSKESQRELLAKILKEV